jgi:transcriptional regulator with XRE-family HTH domain
MHFAEWVKMTREAQGLMMQECAERAKVSQAAWSQYEDETRYKQPRQDTVRKIAHALRVSEEEALKAAGYAADFEAPAEWIALWHRTPADRRAKLMKATRGVQEAIASF